MFGTMKRVWRETRGNILADQLTDTLARLKSADPRTMDEFYRTLLPLYVNLKSKLHNMTNEGHEKLAKQLQNEARDKLDFEVGKSYAIWVIGAWLETAHLPGDRAGEMHQFLDNFLREMEGDVRETKDDVKVDNVASDQDVQEEEKIDVGNVVLNIAKQLGKVECGCSTDEIPGGFGEFGLEVTNPIPAQGINGCQAYLNRLQTNTGEVVKWERIGSFLADNIENVIDGYQIADGNGVHIATLYLSPYHNAISNKAPRGFRLR